MFGSKTCRLRPLSLLVPKVRYSQKEGVPKTVAHPSLPNLTSSSEPDTQASAAKKKAFFRFYHFVQGYAKFPAQVLPQKFVTISRQFVQGSKLLFRDMREFIRVNNTLASTNDWSKACKTLSRRELELYLTLPRDLYKVSPVLILSALPFMQNVAFPLALMYPHRLLSSHFLTDSQKTAMELKSLEKRHMYYRSLFRDLQRGLYFLKGRPHYDDMRCICGTLARGNHPEVQQILNVASQFSEHGPYDVSKLFSHHVRHLMKVHGLSYWFLWRTKVTQYANLVVELDLALEREGLLNLSREELKHDCQLRGFLVEESTSNDEMLEYLQAWIEVTTKLGPKSASLVLHLPVFLGYNKQTRIWDTQSIS